MRRLIPAFATAAALTAATAFAQPAPPRTAVEEPTRGWSALAGYETFSLRDISRNIRPPDASPISWRGAGTVVAGRFDRSSLKDAHIVDGLVSRARDFAYRSPTRSIDAASGDFASRMDVRYEYRRYFFRDVGARGVDIGTGLQAIGNRVAFDRYITPALYTKTRITGGGLGGVLSLRVRRWERAQVYVTWTNGEIVSSLESQHSASPEALKSSGAGDWFTETVVRADWRLTRATKVSATWRRGYEGYSAHHYHASTNRQAFTVGMLYAR